MLFSFTSNKYLVIRLCICICIFSEDLPIWRKNIGSWWYLVRTYVNRRIWLSSPGRMMTIFFFLILLKVLARWYSHNVAFLKCLFIILAEVTSLSMLGEPNFNKFPYFPMDLLFFEKVSPTRKPPLPFTCIVLLFSEFALFNHPSVPDKFFWLFKWVWKGQDSCPRTNNLSLHILLDFLFIYL